MTRANRLVDDTEIELLAREVGVLVEQTLAPHDGGAVSLRLAAAVGALIPGGTAAYLLGRNLAPFEVPDGPVLAAAGVLAAVALLLIVAGLVARIRGES